MERFSREEIIIGKEGVERLSKAHVAVFGIGGVGGHLVEALARAGVGKLTLVDGDDVERSNINRQMVALESTVGKPKVEVAKERINDINPVAKVETLNLFFTSESKIDFSQFDYIADAIDTMSSKLYLIEEAKRFKVPVISAMGAGNKLEPTAFEVADISETSVDPMARIMRQELRKRGVEELKVVYSKEKPVEPKSIDEKRESGRPAPGSMSFVPPVMGMIMAGEIIKDILEG